ncbi:MAG: MBL fold metallo-hydrolase, partial [Pseudomonadota bacterium]|nr:MBL fold metallo-hydrolase [Pseudomonadota bacterium]
MTVINKRLSNARSGIGLTRQDKQRGIIQTAFFCAMTTTAILSFSALAQPLSQPSTTSDDADLSTNPMGCHNVSVQILGSGGPELDDGRTSSAYVVWIND